jgi:hypothetical protein
MIISYMMISSCMVPSSMISYMPTIIIINVNAMVPMIPIVIIISVTAVAQCNSRISHATLTQPFTHDDILHDNILHDDIIMYGTIKYDIIHAHHHHHQRQRHGPHDSYCHHHQRHSCSSTQFTYFTCDVDTALPCPITVTITTY